MAGRPYLSQIQIDVNRLILVSLFVLVSTWPAFSADRRMAFERDETVNIANLGATLVRKLGDGVFPAISPDAKWVAFSRLENTPTTYRRRLGLIEATSGKIEIFKNIPGDNSYQASWSPDGKWIAFVLRNGGQLRLARIKPDGTDFRFIGNVGQQAGPFYSPCWGLDGSSIYCQDTANLYRMGLDGSILKQWEIDKFAPNGAMSADARIDVAPDGNHLLLSIDMDEAYTRKDWNGPVPALWSFDPKTGRAVRVSSKKLFAWEGCWLSNDEILFVSQPAGERTAALYWMRTNGKHLKRLLDRARRPSISRP